MNKEIHITCACEDYPYNLLRAVVCRTRLEFPNSLNKDVLAGLTYALSTLSENAQKLVQLRFQQSCPPEMAAQMMDLPLPQVLELETDTVRKLRIPSRWDCIRLGLSRYIKQKADKAYSKGFRAGYQAGMDDAAAGLLPQVPSEEILNQPLACIGLSTRSLNSLMSNGFQRLREITYLEADRISVLRGIGIRGIREIAQVLRSNGIAGTAWDLFLQD